MLEKHYRCSNTYAFASDSEEFCSDPGFPNCPVAWHSLPGSFLAQWL